MRKRIRFLRDTTLLAAMLFAANVTAAPKPLKVFILAGQSNMDGQANVSTIDFLGEDKEHGYLLKQFRPDGKTLVTRDDVWVAHRGVYGKLAPGKAMAEAMQELMKIAPTIRSYHDKDDPEKKLIQPEIPTK